LKANILFYTLIAALGGLLFGFDTAVINGALPFFSSHFALDRVMQGWAVSSGLIGCVIGAICIGKPGDIFGSRSMLKFLALLFIVTALGTGLAPNFSIFIAARKIGGIAIGGASVLCPIYISEISPAEIRGRLGAVFQLAIVIGILLAFASDLALLNTGINNWRYMFLTGGFPAFVFFAMLFLVPSSPRWLVKVGKEDKAKNVINKLSVPDGEKLFLDIKESLISERVNIKENLFKGQNEPETSGGFHRIPFLISIYSGDGKYILLNQEKSGSVYILNTEAWASGMYFIMLSNGKNKVIRKIFKN
jgi:MFS family permease